MTSRQSQFIKFLFLTLFFVTPLIYYSANSELFEIPKMYFVYFISLLIVTLHCFNYLHGHTPLFQKHSLNLPLILFLGSQAIATIFSIDPHTSFFGYYSRLNGGLLSLFAFSALFFILPNYLNPKFRQQVITTMLASGAIVALFGILEHFDITQYLFIKNLFRSKNIILTSIYGLIDKNSWKTDIQSRVFSTLGQPNWLAAYLCILLPFSLDRFFSSSRLIHKSYFLLLTSSFWICLLFTKSKTGLIATLLSLTVYVIARSIQATKQSRSGLLHSVRNDVYRLSFIVALFVSLSLIIPNPIKDFFFPQKMINGSMINDKSVLITPSEDIRKIVWQGAIELWKRNPVLGTGPETFAFSYYWTRPASHNLTSEWQFLYNKAHNEYLNYLATSGLVGFLSYLFFVFSALYVIRNTLYLIPFLSILITNISGFSVVTISLFFFLLPLLAVDSPVTIHNSYIINRKSRLLLTFILVSSFLFLVSKIIFFYLADIAHSKSIKFDKHDKYSEAYQFASLAHNLRPGEPTYLTTFSTASSKMAVSTQDKQYVSPAINSINQAVKISPYDTNLLKQRAQIYYYLSFIDKNYYLDTLSTLTHLTEISPTDPSNYYLLGRFYQNISETNQAITNYQQAIKLKSNYDHATFALGELYYQQKKYSEAKPLLEQTLVIAPTNLQAKDYLARIATASAIK